MEEVRGYAAGLYASVFFTGDGSGAEVGPTPEVFLPPEGGGPFTESLPVVNFDGSTEPGDAQLSSEVVVSTEGQLGPDGYASSNAVIEELGQAEASETLVSADLVEVECSSDILNGPIGSTTILGGLVADADIVGDVIEIEESPEPNTVVLDLEFEETFDGGAERVSLRVVANEQVIDGDGITVRGLHSSLHVDVVDEAGTVLDELTLELIAGEVSCGVDVLEPAAPVEPPTTTVPAEDLTTPAGAAVAAPRFTG